MEWRGLIVTGFLIASPVASADVLEQSGILLGPGDRPDAIALQVVPSRKRVGFAAEVSRRPRSIFAVAGWLGYHPPWVTLGVQAGVTAAAGPVRLSLLAGPQVAQEEGDRQRTAARLFVAGAYRGRIALAFGTPLEVGFERWERRWWRPPGPALPRYRLYLGWRFP